MDTISIAGSSLLLRVGQAQQALSTTMMKQAADQQNKMAELLAMNAKQAPQPTADSGFSFSIFA
jgi:hypothetical protein